MEPEVCIVEMMMEGLYKVFANGVSFVICSGEELAAHLEGKAHLFLLMPNEMDQVEIKRLAGRIFKASELGSMCVMYSAVATSFALGIQSLVFVSIFSLDNAMYRCNINLVAKSSLNLVKSKALSGEFGDVMEEVARYLGPGNTGAEHIYVKATDELKARAMEALGDAGLIRREEEVDRELGVFGGYRVADLPSYFARLMPHNMLVGSDLSYVGGVLTTMINYFEIKEVTTREDFEAGSAKYLILN